MMTTGWAVIDVGKIDIYTVSGTRRAAIVNWLWRRGTRFYAHTTDVEIDDMWDRWRGSAKVARVKIAEDAE
jgi:hypothetical protein